MVRNVFLKKLLKNTIFPFVSLVNKLIPKDDNVILLYIATMGIRHSLVPLRQYLLDNNFDKKYKIICGIENMKYAENLPKVSFVGKLGSYLAFFRAGHVFYTAGQLPIKPSKSQIVIHMSHGNADFKNVGKNTNIDNGDEYFFTYMIASSDLYVPVWASAYECPISCVKVAGDPLCDQLLNYRRDEYDFSPFNKLLVWLPTFRQSDAAGYNDSSMETLVPLFDENDYEELNAILANYNIRLIVKLHTGQNAPDGMKRHFSHFSLFSHREFLESGYDLYKLIAHSDGLVGDYSSVSLQYLLTDRPQAYVVPDIEDYAATRGFVFENPEAYMGGHIIKTKEEFKAFIEDFANDRDVFKEKRKWVCGQIYKYHDTKSCERIIALSNIKM